MKPASILVEHMAETADAMGLDNFHAVLGGERSPRPDTNSADAVYEEVDLIGELDPSSYALQFRLP